MSKKEVTSKEKKAKQAEAFGQEAKTVFVRGILGLALLTVFGSIAFMVVVIWQGTDNPVFKILTLPAALFDLVIAFVAFSKILK